MQTPVMGLHLEPYAWCMNYNPMTVMVAKGENLVLVRNGAPVMTYPIGDIVDTVRNALVG